MKHLLIGIVSFFPVSLLCLGAEDEKLYVEGVNLQSSGYFERAIPYFERVVKASPKNHDALYRLAICYEKTMKFDQALEAYQKLDAFKSNYPQLSFAKGKVYYTLNKFSEAETHFRQSEKLGYDPDGSKYFYHSDHLGSTSVLTDQNTNAIENTTYEPFGAEISGGNLDVKGYTGQFDDELTNQMYYGARYYLPSVGQFISADPEMQNAHDPQLLNHYGYTRNNPYLFTDPDGKKVELVGRQVQYGPVGFFGNHYYLVLIPDKPSDFPETPKGFILGAYDVGDRLQFRENAEPRGPDQNIRYAKAVNTPVGMTDTDFIRNIQKTAQNYQESGDYEAYDALSTQGGLNSNTAAISALVAAGADKNKINPDALFLDPGFKKLSPKILKNSPLPMCVGPSPPKTIQKSKTSTAQKNSAGKAGGQNE